MKKKSVSGYLLVVFIIFVLVLYFSLKDNYLDIINVLGSVNIFYFLLGVLFVFASKYLIAETTYLLAKKERSDVKRLRMLKICLIYPFFAGITPSSVGGESFEIFYLRDSKIPVGKASNIVVQKFILYQISLIIVNVIAVIINMFTHIVPNNSMVMILIILNFVVNIIGLLFSYLLGYNKKFNHFIMKKGLSFLHKIKIVKNIEKTRDKVDRYLENFDDGVDKLKKDKKLFVKLIFYNILSIVFIIICACPLAISMNISSISMINIFVLVTYVRMLSLLIVTPGNSGASEYSFVYLFTSLLDSSVIISYMLLWRLITYYIPLIVGGVLALTWKKEDKNEQTFSTES